MTTPGSSGRPEHDPGPRVLRDMTLEWLSLDLHPGPYAGLAASPAQAFPSAVACPLCHEVTPLPGGGSDDELELFWEHLRTHTTHPLVLIQLWVTAMGRAR